MVVLRLGLLTLVSALTIYLPESVASLKRCPSHGTTDLSTVQSYADETFCNVYHTCNCTKKECKLVESHVCPIAKVFSKSKLTCLDIEEEGCQTTYVQWVQSHSTQTGKNETEIAIMVSDTLLLNTSIRPFQCEQQQEGKFSDPHICNIFHVCTQRNGLMVDQPFMCPFPTVFKRVSSSGKAFCAHAEGNDCHGKAFYRNAAEKMNNTEMFNYRLPDKTLMMQSCKKSGLYPDPFYCNAYHRCTSNEEDEHYLCENQLLFNPESNICDYPINVVCEGW